MKVGNKNYRTIWEKNGKIIIIDQRYLPTKFVLQTISTFDQMVIAIKDMHLRGAGLIGAAAGFGMYLATKESKDFYDIEHSAQKLIATRPTAINLTHAVNQIISKLINSKQSWQKIALDEANKIANDDAQMCRKIGINGLKLIKKLAKKENSEPLNILTHCNAGWLAFVDYGSALSPIYAAHKANIPIHVWVSETRPRNQGALTAWELSQENIPHTIVTDNMAGHLMQRGMVDLVIVGADRVTKNGDVANKIGTYLKAIAALEHNIPFYVAFPSSTIDNNLNDGLKIPIEERNQDEVTHIQGQLNGKISKIKLTQSKAYNLGFDITPSKYITGYITEKGIQLKK